jgi:hypothetical protein
MKRPLLLLLVLAFAAPVITFSGCSSETAQEKAWEKDIPNVPPADTTKSRVPANP